MEKNVGSSFLQSWQPIIISYVLKGEKKEEEDDEENPDKDDVKTDTDEKEGEEKEEKKKKKPTLKLASIANMTEEPRVRFFVDK